MSNIMGFGIDPDDFEDWNEFDDELKKRRDDYLAACNHEQISFTLTDFFFVEDGVYPDDFELVLVVLKDGRLSGGCAERGLEHTKNNPKGVIHQSRGGVIEYEDIIAWKPLEEVYINLPQHKKQEGN